jgi:predicted permease
MTLAIIFAILEIFGVFCVGWMARHFGYIREQELDRWSRFAVDVLLPALVFHSITENFEADRFGELWVLPLAGFGMIAFGAVAGFLFRLRVKNHSPDLVKTFHHLCAVNNYGFLPIIIVQNLWGETALSWLFFLNLGSNIGYWTIGVGLLGQSDIRKAVHHIITPSLMALFLALFLSLTGWNVHVPDVLTRIFGSVGAAAVPCVLILVGAGMYPFPSLRYKGVVAYLTVVRLLVLPALMVAGLKHLSLPRDVQNIAIVVALMPAAMSSTVLTRRYGGDPDFAAGAAVVTTIVSLVTIPIGLGLLMK